MVYHDQIAITGGSGHLGSCITQMLLEQGNTVRSLYHSSKTLKEHKNLHWCQGNISQPASLDQFVKDSSVMIHAASMISLGEKNNDDVYKINIVGTENIIKICTDNNIRMIYISSATSVEEKPYNEIFNEKRPHKTGKEFFYAWTKAKAEQKVLEAVKKHNLDAIIIRPTAIVGPPDFKPSRFGQTIWELSKGKIPIISTGGYNIIDVRDISKTIITSISKGIQGEIYLVGGKYASLKEIAKIANPEKNLFCVSINLLILCLPIIDIYKRLVSLKWPVTKESLLTLKNAPKMVDSSKAITNLAHETRPISETIHDLIYWLNTEYL